MHEFSEPTKRAIDVGGTLVTAAAGAVGAITLAQVALIVTILVGLLQAIWIGMRIRHGLKNGVDAAASD